MLIQTVLMALFTVLNTRDESRSKYVMKYVMKQKLLFNDYMFECMAALIRFVCDENYGVVNNWGQAAHGQV